MFLLAAWSPIIAFVLAVLCFGIYAFRIKRKALLIAGVCLGLYFLLFFLALFLAGALGKGPIPV